MASAITVLVVQGQSHRASVSSLAKCSTEAQVSALTATGGVLLLGVGLRLLRIKVLPVADLLPALLLAPILVGILTTFLDS